MRGPQRLTKVPPAQAEAWYSAVRPCVGCRGQLLNRFEREDGVWIRVLHEETCKVAGPDRASESRSKPRSGTP